MRIESLFRYPVKGLTPEPLIQASLAPGKCIPWDRAFALKQGDADLDEENPTWLYKTNFMCLAKNAIAAQLDAKFDETTQTLNVKGPEASISASPFTKEGQAALTQYFTAFLGEEARYGQNNTPPQFHFFPGHSFCDNETQVVSLIGLSSIAALEQAVTAKRHKMRFRA
ncbi:MAG: MOSC N-terminal beta barrel domain-containing protein, partial [Rhodospirillales bacterium]|nr:MOSC N-terminal beta barrel domain-containing protein [Rhodospirillales bacterium]